MTLKQRQRPAASAGSWNGPRSIGTYRRRAEGHGIVSSVVLLIVLCAGQSAGRDAFCVMDLHNRTASMCTMQCADADNTLFFFDLRPLLISKFSEFAGDDGTQYRWDPCTPLDIEGSPSCSSETGDPAICRFDVDQWKSIGQLPPAEIILHAIGKEDGPAYTYIYNDSNVQSNFDFICNHAETPGVINEDSEKQVPQTKYHFVVESSYACAVAVTPTRPTTSPPPQSSLPLSPGAIVVIAVVGCVALYLLSGMAYKGIGKGAKGFEVIPNIDVWTKLGTSIKMGALWIISPCYKGKSTAKLYYQKV